MLPLRLGDVIFGRLDRAVLVDAFGLRFRVGVAPVSVLLVRLSNEDAARDADAEPPCSTPVNLEAATGILEDIGVCPAESGEAKNPS